MLSDQQLQTLTESLSEACFGKPFLHMAAYNPRLRTTGGRYMLGDHSIQVNPEVERMHGRQELIGVLKHELCHYHLHLEGKGYKHGDQEFKDLLHATGAPRFCKTLQTGQARKTRHYVCRACGQRYERRRKVDTTRYRCGKCHGELSGIPE